MNRTRWIAVAVAVAAVACADDTPAQVSSVAIAATPCDRPTARLGVGTLVAEGRVLTAAHVVEDDLRDVAVDGQPARVVALDPASTSRYSASMQGRGSKVMRATFADAEIADAVRIVTPTEVIETTVERIVTLTVDDTTDGVVRHRAALVLDGAVPEWHEWRTGRRRRRPRRRDGHHLAHRTRRDVCHRGRGDPVDAGHSSPPLDRP